MSGLLVRALVVALGISVLSLAPADAAAPDTKITSGPKKLVNSKTAVLKFSSTQNGSTFECKLDKKPFAACTSPKRYSRLSEGKHTFRVRAARLGQGDPSPAKHTWTVDTTKPDTTITTGPTGVTHDSTPTFTFSSTEAGSFSCRVGAVGSFQPCVSPYTLPEVDDEVLVVFVRSRDKAGNLEKTPASRQFEFITPITEDQATAEEAAELYFPDAVLMDVPPNCTPSPATFDCPGGVEDPPADQVSASSTRAVVDAAEDHSFDVTVTSTVATPIAIKMSVPGSAECTIQFGSAPGSQTTWTVTTALNFVEVDGELQIQRGATDVTGIEAADIQVPNGAFPCNLLTPNQSTVEGLYISALEAHFATVGDPLCAASGPAYLGPCPPT